MIRQIEFSVDVQERRYLHFAEMPASDLVVDVSMHLRMQSFVSVLQLDQDFEAV